MAELSRRGIPFIFTPHGKLSGQVMGNKDVTKLLWWSAVVRRYLRRASAVAVSGIGEANLFPSLGLPRPSLAIPNGHDAPTEVTGTPIVEGPYILFLGYLDPRKQPEFLVRAFACSKAYASHTLVIVGPDAYGHEGIVRAVANECGISDRVNMLGPKYGPEKWNLLRHASCLCLPSRGEGLPVVLCEALGAGLPIVYSKACNFPEVHTQGAGVELDGFSEAEWANAIDRLCLDEATRTNMRAAANRLAGEYSWESIVTRWLDLYDTVWGRSVVAHSNAQIVLT
jgi:glycosyltransferase involved in cell wall biosynthesis